MMRKHTFVFMSALSICSLPANALLDKIGVVNPCEEKVFGLFALSKTTRMNALEEQVAKEQKSSLSTQRFVKYDVEETASKITNDFTQEINELEMRLLSHREEYNFSGTVTLDNSTKLKGYAASEFLKIMLIRHNAYLSGVGYLKNIHTELDEAYEHFAKVDGRLEVIASLIGNADSDDVFSSACIALKDIQSMNFEMPFNDAVSLKNYALKQSDPLPDGALETFLTSAKFPNSESLVINKLNNLLSWAKSLLE